MKVFIIGGINQNEQDDRSIQLDRLRNAMFEIGRSLERDGHELVVCSPFEGTADLEALRGFASVPDADGKPVRGEVEIHHPNDMEIGERARDVIKALGLERARLFRHAAIRSPSGDLDRTYSWLLAQLAALDRSQTIIALGGNTTGSASLLLNLAESRNCPILPLGFMGGAAAEVLERHRYELMDRLGDQFHRLFDPEVACAATSLAEDLLEQSSRMFRPSGITKFFISYARDRPEEADFVEMSLRRRNYDVFRDEHSFAAGGLLPSEIRDRIFGTDVFIAIWCKEYACSPWCHDELELALDRRDEGRLQVIILSVDDTRMVPPRARQLIAYNCQTRVELEARVRMLSDLQVSASQSIGAHPEPRGSA